MPTSAGFALWRVSNVWQRAQRSALGPLGLTPVQALLLEAAVALDGTGPITQRRLADEAKTDPMMTSQVARTLQHNGLVRRADHPEDRRAFAIQLTPKGRATHAKAAQAMQAVDQQFFDAVDPASLVEALEALVPAPTT